MDIKALLRRSPLHIPYTIVAFGGYLILCLLFFGIQHIVPVRWLVSVPLDEHIPFYDWFVIPYVLWYAFFFGTAIFFLHIATRSRAYERECVQFLLFLFSGYILSTILFILVPNGFPLRPAVEDMDTSRPLTAIAALLFEADYDARNVFPSLHCLVQFNCTAALLRSTFISRKTKRWLAPILIVFSVLVFLSTVFIRQHSVLDVVGALAFGIPMYFLSYKINWWFLPKEDGDVA